MRFNWRGHLAVTAFAAFSLLPFAGCSSQQQQSGDEVEASEDGQQVQEEGEVSQQETAQQEAGQQGEVAANEGSGNEVVSNNSVGQNNAPAGDGDLQEIINEMGGDGQAQAEVPATGTEEVAAAEAAPVEAGTETLTEAAPAATDAAAATPAAASSVQGLPEMGSKMPYVVESGDTLGKIATKIYGDQKRWRDISSLTGLSNPNHIFPGDVVYFSMDDASVKFAESYAAIRRGKETVQAGDTLASISSRVYGTSKGWRHIWRQNDNIDNPDKLTVGMTVYYVEKDFVKTAFNHKNIKSNKNLQTKNHSQHNHTQHVTMISTTASVAIAATV